MATLPVHVSAVSPLGDNIDGSHPVRLSRPGHLVSRQRRSDSVAVSWKCPCCGERHDDAREHIAHLTAELTGTLHESDKIHYDSWGRQLCASNQVGSRRRCNAPTWRFSPSGNYCYHHDPERGMRRWNVA